MLRPFPPTVRGAVSGGFSEGIIARRTATGWRALRTGFAFAVYGLGALALGGLLLPLRARLGGGETGAQRWIYRASRGYLAFASALGLIRVRVEGGERLHAPGARLVVANHPSLLDTPLLAALLPQADFVVKPSWADHPFLAPACRAAGYLRSEGGPAFVEAGVRRLRAGRSIVMFPEGTRSPAGGGVGRFQRGAAHLALGSGCELLPVVIRLRPRSLMRGQRWYEVPDRRLEFRVSVLEPLAPEVLAGGRAPGPRAARAVTAAVQELYEKVEVGG